MHGGDAASLDFEGVAGVQRDVLPIPLGPEALLLLKGHSLSDFDLSLGQRRKAARCRRQERWMLDGVAALNEPGGGGRAANCSGPLSQAQRSSLRHLAEVYAAVPPRPDECTD